MLHTQRQALGVNVADDSLKSLLAWQAPQDVWILAAYVFEK